MHVVKASGQGTPRLKNGGFEELQAGTPAHWRPWHGGFHLAPAAGRHGSAAVLCERAPGDDEMGAGQTIELNSSIVAPLLIRGWSKSEDVSGSPDSGYSLYIDIQYVDGTTLWGQHVSFDCGTHDWELRRFVLLPEKAIKALTLHCLFRGHIGKAWFDDISLDEAPAPAGSMLFQGVPVQELQTAPPRGGKSRRLRTSDGLALSLQEGSITSLRVSGTELCAQAPSGFLARDLASDSDYFGFKNESCPDLNLQLRSRLIAQTNAIFVEGSLSNTAATPRAVTLLFALPLEASGWTWGDDVRARRRIEGTQEFAQTVTLDSGANGRMSRYPLAAVWNDRFGLGLALDMNQPAQYRLVYHAGTHQFFIAYDFGLLPAGREQCASARFRFALFRFEPRWGFRAALEKFYDIFPEQFAKRVPSEGIWMPFTDIAKVPGFDDFGFGFQEGAPNVPFDDAHGFLSFIYVEPMSHWLAMPPEAPRTYEGALEVLKRDLRGARGEEAREMASATLSSGIHQTDGRLVLHLEKAPWCDGGVFALNPDPELAPTVDWPFTKAMVMRRQIDAAFRRNEPPNSRGHPGAGLDGVYLDSFEMSAGQLNYRAEQFGNGGAPLVFDREGRPCQLMIFNTWKFARDLAERMHARGKLTFANSVLWQFSFPAPVLDVMGTEVNWLAGGEFHADSDAVMNFRRALCDQKPYCLLMNTDYAKFSSEMVEQYFQRCLFYGIWPSFFDQEAASKDPYWASPQKWYERDRSLFKKYIPLLRRVTAAGWQPVTHVTSNNVHILIERFGPDSSGRVFLTLLNDASTPQSGTLTADSKARWARASTVPHALLSDRDIAGRNWQITLGAGQAEVLLLAK